MIPSRLSIAIRIALGTATENERTLHAVDLHVFHSVLGRIRVADGYLGAIYSTPY